MPVNLKRYNYYPFGMTMPGRSFNASKYRYGFNGQERSIEIHENSFTAEFWEYESRLGRRWNPDPVVKPNESSYLTFSNNPIWFTDPNGADTIKAHINSKGIWKIDKVTIVKGNDVFILETENYIITTTYKHMRDEGHGNRLIIHNIVNNKNYTLGIYHVSGKEGKWATGFAITPGGESSLKVGSGKRLPEDTYTLTPSPNSSTLRWVQPLVTRGKKGGYIGKRGIKIHPAASKSTKVNPRLWTAGCFVVCTDYTKEKGIIFYNSMLSIQTSKQLNTLLGATQHFNNAGELKRPGSTFDNGIKYKLVQFDLFNYTKKSGVKF